MFSFFQKYPLEERNYSQVSVKFLISGALFHLLYFEQLSAVWGRHIGLKDLHQCCF